MKEENIIDTFFNIRQDEFLEEMGEDIDILRPVLKKENKRELQESINEIPNEYEELKTKLKNGVDDLISNYEIKMAYYHKKYYKQGFKDAVMLNFNLKEKWYIKHEVI